MKSLLIIPTYNGERTLEACIESIFKGTLLPTKVFILDSSSSDNTIQIAKKYNVAFEVIGKESFNHGLSRQYAIEKNLEAEEFDVAIFLTQDVLLADSSSIKNLLLAFEDESVACAYGRQLTLASSSLLEKYSRAFNYPKEPKVKSKQDIATLGLSAPFCSDSFAAYRIKTLLEIGGFPKCNFGEDMLVAAKFILAGFKVAYAAYAECYHSHPFKIKAEYNRGREIALMHKTNRWLIEEFGNAESRGVGLLKTVPLHLKPIVLLEALPKFFGYRLNK